MSKEPQSDSGRPAREITSVSVLGARVTWALLGPAAMMLLALGIARTGEGWLTVIDAIFAIAVGWTAWGRWFDERSSEASTAGHSAWPFPRYAVVLLAVAAVMWLTANVLGNHVLG